MSQRVKRRFNAMLGRATGYQLQRAPTGRRANAVHRGPPRTGDRLVVSPVFVLSSVRSGSTLLRVVLDSHSLIRAPHELHVRTLRVRIEKDYARRSMRLLRLDESQLEYLLWDRVLHRELCRSGKRIIVDKTPGNAFVWQRLAECWPAARYVFLLRDPRAMVASLHRAHPDRTTDADAHEVLRYCQGVEAARAKLAGTTVRYEDLTRDPQTTFQDLCRYLDVEFEPAMLDYGASDHGPFRAGLGDWSQAIRGGKIIEASAHDDDFPISEPVREMARVWGYRAR